eukprot:3935457-Rhodomonas_salina.2
MNVLVVRATPSLLFFPPVDVLFLVLFLFLLPRSECECSVLFLSSLLAAGSLLFAPLAPCWPRALLAAPR